MIFFLKKKKYICQTKKKQDPELPSCGCVELARKTKHGYRKAKDTHPTYKIYRGMMDRCYNPNSKGYQWYGAVGVTVCDEWNNKNKNGLLIFPILYFKYCLNKSYFSFPRYSHSYFLLIKIL